MQWRRQHGAIVGGSSMAVAAALRQWWRLRGDSLAAAVVAAAEVLTREFEDFLYHRHSATLCSYPLLSWEQGVPLEKIQQSTSNGDNGRRDGNTTAMATAMDGAMAMWWQHNGNAMASTMQWH